MQLQRQQLFHRDEQENQLCSNTANQLWNWNYYYYQHSSNVEVFIQDKETLDSINNKEN